MRSGPVPTPAAAGLAGVIAVAALGVSGPVVVVLLLALAAGMGLDFLRVRRPPTVVRTLPSLLSRGVPAPIEIAVDDASATLAQPTPSGLDCTPLRDGAGSLTASRRGRHVLPPVVVRRTGLLRLGSWIHQAGGEAVLRVYPDLPAAQRLSRVARITASAVAGQSPRGPLGLGTDFEALREYRPDDDVRQVNWRATARMGRPMSNTYRVEQSRRVLLALDCGRVVAAPLAGRLSRLDIFVDAAAAVAMSADRVGDRIGLIAYDDGPRALVRPATGGAREVLRALADMEPRPVDSDPELLPGGLPRGQRTTVLIFTDLLDVTAVRSLVDALPGIASRHTVSVLSVIDEDLDAVLRGPVRTLTRAALVAAAADLVEARLQAAALLRRAGAKVIEARADALPGAAVRALTAGSVR